MKNNYRLSAIICTNREASYLKRSLSSLQNQINAHQCEIIIVNNDPERLNLDETLDSWPESDAPELREVVCEIPGLSHARNAGLKQSKGDIVLYLDDDIVADENLFNAMLSAYEQLPEAGVIGGLVKLYVPNPAPEWYGVELAQFWSEYIPKGDSPTYCTDWTDFPFGANWSARRQCLLEIDGFRTKYGRGSGEIDSGEETVAAIEIEAKGYRIGQTPEACVTHHIDADRLTKDELFRIGLHNFDTAVAMAEDRYIELFWGWFGCYYRGVAKRILSYLPGINTRSKRLGLRAVSRGHFRTAHQLFKRGGM